MKVIKRHTAATTNNPEHIGKPRIVEFTAQEAEVYDLREQIVEETGIPEPEAGSLAVVVMPNPTPEFVSFLVDGIADSIPGR